jgi:hypothetical protein
VTVEWRLIVDKGYAIASHPKRDREHAEKGVDDAFRDFDRMTGGDSMDAYIETREVTEWRIVN